MKASFNNIFTYLLERLIYLKVNYLFVEYQDVRKRRK